jgi:hypothetical protein
MKSNGTQRVKSTLQELLELEGLIREFKRLKARQIEIIKGLGAPQEALVAVESDLNRIQRSIQARGSYTNPRLHINWN